MEAVLVPAPLAKLSSSADIVAWIAATQAGSQDAASGTRLETMESAKDPRALKDVKSKVIRLVSTGYAPYGKPLGGEQSVEPVVATVSEDKVLKLFQADTGKVFYERYDKLSIWFWTTLLS